MKVAKQIFITALEQQNQDNFTSTCRGYDLIIMVGILPSRDNEKLFQELQKSASHGTKLIYLFSMEDKALSPQTTFFSRYEVGSEEGVFALLAKGLLAQETLPKKFQNYFNELDEGYLSAESNLGEEEIEEIALLYKESKNTLLVLGDDLVTHPRAKHIALLAGLIAHFGKAKIWVSNLEEVHISSDDISLPVEVEALKSFDGVVVYQCPIFIKEEEDLLIGSPQFQMAAKVQNGEKVSISFAEQVHVRKFVVDSSLKGTIALMPSVLNHNTSYRYHVAKIVKAEG